MIVMSKKIKNGKLSMVNEKENIQSHIFTIRGLQVIIDSDLADIYGVETKNLNLAVKSLFKNY